MNTKLKIAAGMLAAIIVGTTLVGTAFAAPRMMTSATYGGYGMMRPLGASGVPGIGEMRSFMSRYGTPARGFDFNRMHRDIASGKVTPPCLDGAKGRSGARSPLGKVPGRTSGMMDNIAPISGSGYGMMGGVYN